MSQLPTMYQEEACRAAAREAKLRYVKDTSPGITRKKVRDDFHYIAPNSERITADDVLARIHSLAIPPAYSDVWICTLANGHLQATGRDARRRKQYRYHPKWQEIRSSNKFAQMRKFAEALPKIRTRIAQDMKLSGLPREKVLASIVHLMDQCNMRVGNDQYAADNNTYGLTTMRKKHVTVVGDRIEFEFIGKSGKLWKRDLRSKQVAKIIKHCEELPGQELFKYLDEAGSRIDVVSDDVNDYLQEITSEPFTAKDFRTWTATSMALELLAALEPQDTKTAHTKQLNDTIKRIAAEMGHTPAICRKCYIYPGVLTQYEEGALPAWFAEAAALDEHARVGKFLADY